VLPSSSDDLETSNILDILEVSSDNEVITTMAEKQMFLSPIIMLLLR
jgi:hypothetical protein